MSILFSLIGAGVFFSLFFAAHLHILAAAGIGVAAFIGLELTYRRVKKIRKAPIDDAKLLERLKDIDKDARETMRQIRVLSARMPAFRASCNRLSTLSKQILDFVEQNPNALSKSEHFLDYYFPMFQNIMKNYISLHNVMLEDDKRQQIESSTQESLNYLETIFRHQLEGYHNNKILEIEAQSDLLEKTVKLGGDL